MNNKTQNRLKDLLANTGDMALKRRARRIIEEINPKPGDNILEVGCGDGFYLHLLINLGIKNLTITGVDIDENALRSARKNLRGKGINLKKADVMKKLSFEDDSFDKIIMSEVCEHLPDDVKGLREAKRVLKKGGTLVVTVPNHNYPFFWDPVNWVLEHLLGTHIKSGFWAGLWNQHLRLYKPEEIKKSVEMAGMDISKVESLTWWCLPFNHFIINIGARILVRGGGNINIIGGGSKFKAGDKKGIITIVYYYLATSVDKLNNLGSSKNGGVGLLVAANKVV